MALDRRVTLNRLSQHEDHKNVFYSDQPSDLSPIYLYDLGITHVMYIHRDIRRRSDSILPNMNPDNVGVYYVGDPMSKALECGVKWIERLCDQSPHHRILVYDSIDLAATIRPLLSTIKPSQAQKTLDV